MTTENTLENTSRLPLRHEVPVELTWNLDVIYSDDAAWESDYVRLENACAEFAKLTGSLSENAQRLLHVLAQRDELGIALSQLYSYASLRRSENNADAGAQAKADRANMLYTKYGSATAWVEPEILAMPSSQVRDFLESESGLQTYAYYLETLERRRPHVRSSEVEDVLAQAGEAMHATGTVFKLFNNADLKFPKVRDDEGREVELSQGRYLSFLESRNRKVREEAFRTMHGAYFNWRNTLAANLAGTIKAHVFNARVRGYESALHASMESNDIPVPVYGNLVSTVRERLPVLHRYLRLAQKTARPRRTATVGFICADGGRCRKAG